MGIILFSKIFTKGCIKLVAASLASLSSGIPCTRPESEVADAAMQQKEEAVLRLISQGFDVNASQADGATALQWAAYHRDADLVTLLLDAGADPSIANRNGSTPMWLAANQGDTETIRLYWKQVRMPMKHCRLDAGLSCWRHVPALPRLLNYY